MHTLFALLLAAQVGQGLPVRPPSDVATVPRDFAITVLGLNADGVFAFTVANHGNAVTQPFKVSAYLDGYLRETVQFNIRGDLNGGRFATPTALHGEKLRSGCRRVL